jgi:4-amino-4-deoxy-L-arabinose transferase-like glycosyltransferase
MRNMAGVVTCRRRAPVAAALVLLMGLLSGLPSLWTRDLWYDDEIRLTEGARELAEFRDWTLPRVNGEAVVEAPPLPYRITALIWEAGAGTASARVLSLLAVLGIALACFMAAARGGGLARGVLVAAIALTTMTLFWHVRKGGTGPLWALFLTLALLAGCEAISAKPTRRSAWWVACYAAAALAVLCVGFSAALLIAAVLGVYCFLAGRRLMRPVRSHLPGLAVFAGMTMLWLAGVSRASPEPGLAFRLLTQDFAGLAESLREGDMLKGVLAAAVGSLPWVAVVPGAFAAAIRQRHQHDRHLALFAAVWLAVLVVPAMLGGREGAPDYVIAAAPPMAILCAGVFVPGADLAAPSKAQRRLVRVLLAGFAAFTGLIVIIGLFHLAGGTYFIVGRRHVCPVADQPYSPYTLTLALPFVAASLMAVVRALRTPAGRPSRQAWLLVLAVFLLGIPADLFLTPVLNAFRSGRPFADEIAQRVRPAESLYLYRKDYDGLYNLYTGRMVIPVLADSEQLLERLSLPGVFVIAEQKRIERVRPPKGLHDLSVAQGRLGHRDMLLLRSEPPAEAIPAGDREGNGGPGA